MMLPPSRRFCQVSRQPTRCSGSLTIMRHQPLWLWRILARDLTDRLSAPSQPYTRALLAADPATWEHRAPTGTDARVVAGRSLSMARGVRRLFEDIDVEVGSGEIVSIV